jgi:hypothetical protein
MVLDCVRIVDVDGTFEAVRKMRWNTRIYTVGTREVYCSFPVYRRINNSGFQRKEFVTSLSS